MAALLLLLLSLCATPAQDTAPAAVGQWVAQNSGVLTRLLGVFFTDRKQGWVVGSNGLLLSTNDGGANWKNVTPKGLAECLINAIEISPHDKATAYIATTRYKFNDHTPGLYKTTDYGATWTKIDSGIPFIAQKAGDKPILTSVEVVDDLLRNMIADAVSDFELVNAGELDQAKAVANSEGACRKLSDLLLGKANSDEYFAQPWNSPRELGHYVRVAEGLTCPDDDAVYTALLNMIAEILGMYRHALTHGLEPDDWTWEIDGVVEKHVHLFLGLSYSSDV